MKTKLLTLAASIFATLAIVCFAACNNQNKNVTTTTIDDNTAVVFTAESSVMEIGETTTLKNYMDALKAKGDLTYEGTESSYGTYITSINGKAGSTADSTYWAIYIDFTTLDDGTIYATDYQTVQYNGKTLYSASYGVSGIPCVEGHIYAFVFSSY